MFKPHLFAAAFVPATIKKKCTYYVYIEDFFVLQLLYLFGFSFFLLYYPYKKNELREMSEKSCWFQHLIYIAKFSLF